MTARLTTSKNGLEKQAFGPGSSISMINWSFIFVQAFLIFTQALRFAQNPKGSTAAS